MIIIGLTGGIGSGKSTVANLFAKLDVPIIDSDIIAREVVMPGQSALEEIVKTFGDDYLTSNGELNRLKLRQLIFDDADKRQQLEAILHPRIRTEMQHRAQALNTAYCIFVIPLLIEVEQQNLVDRILVVDSPDDLRRQRLKERDHMSDEAIDKIFTAQIQRQQRIDTADDVITNDTNLKHLQVQVLELHQKYSLIANDDVTE